MKKWLVLFLLASPTVARAELVTPNFTQGSMNSTTTTTQVVQEVKQTQVFGSEVKSWSGSNVTPSGDIADAATTFSVTDTAADWTLELTTRAAGLVEQIDSTTDWTINTTTTSLSVFSQ